MFFETYAKAKPPVTPAGVQECGGVGVRWGGHRCIQLNGVANIGDKKPSAVILLPISGRPFPEMGSLPERKTHTLGGSQNSWLVSGTPEEIEQAHTIVDVEGVPDLLAAASVLPQDWVAVTNTSGASARGKLSRKWCKGKCVIVVGDADEPGQEGLQRAAVAYSKAGAEVLTAKLPFPIEKTHGKDLRDWLNEGHKLEDLPASPVTAEQIEEWSKKTNRKKRSGEREIAVATDESRVIDEAIAVLATQENIFERGSTLVHIVSGSKPPKGISRPGESPRIISMRYPRIRELLADAAYWYLAGDDDQNPIHPPEWVVKGAVARDQWPGIRRLEAVVEAPVLRADGTVLQEPGYDPLTGIFFLPGCEYPGIPDKPTRDDAVSARDAILEVVEDFPFANKSHLAAWVAGVLTPLARYAYSGPSPLFLNDANVRGCGKSLLTDATSVIATGRGMARMSMPRDDDELRKRITAMAMVGEPLILIDNIVGMFGSPSLDAALTATTWSDRILGQTAMATAVPLYAVWYATGNNIILGADTARRVVHIRLESPEENPETRTGFHHADLLSWVKKERPRLTVAAITILAAYYAAGRPDMNLSPWGSFEGWSNLVRQAVVWAGMADPGASRTDLNSQADREAVALRQLIEGWEEIDPSSAGMTVAAILQELAAYPTHYEGLKSALFELAPPRDGKTLNPRSIGMKLHHLRRRVVGGKLLDKRDSRQGAIWRVYASDQCGTNGTSGTSFTPYAHTHTHTCAHEIPTGGGSSPASPASPATPDPCLHTNVAEEPTFDGYVNVVCADCRKSLGCHKQPAGKEA